MNITKPTVGALWRSFQKELEPINPAPKEGQIILAAALGCEPADLIHYESAFVTDEVLTRATATLARRKNEEPLAYILGFVPFWSQNWHITPGTLIPRPDSETLVAEVLTDTRENLRVLEIGTGSGALLGSVLLERPTWHGTGVENAPTALACSQINLSPFISDNRCKLFNNIDNLYENSNNFHIIFTNPPYVSEDEFAALEPTVKNHEPKSALTGEMPNPTGLVYYQDWLPRLIPLLAPGGTLLMEIGATQAHAVKNLCLHNGLADISIIKDLAGRDRVVKGNRPS